MTESAFLLAQQTAMPTLDGTFFALLLSRILHIVAAIILVGGLFYIRTIISPATSPSGATPADQLFGGPRSKWAKWVGIATALLLVTGLFNYIMIIKQHDRLAPSYHMLAGLKMLAALVVFLIAALLAGRTAAADAIRANFRTWLTFCLLLGIITVIFGSLLRTYPRTRKNDVTISAPQLIAPANPANQ